MRVPKHRVCRLAPWVIVAAALLGPDAVHATAKAPPTPSHESITKLGNIPLSGCLTFGAKSELDARRKQWRKALAEAFDDNPAQWIAWTLGQAQPPVEILRESETQRDCLLARFMAESDEASEVLSALELSKRVVRTSIEKARKNSEVLSWIKTKLVRSHYRDARVQAFMWRRRGRFNELPVGGVGREIVKGCATLEGTDERRPWAQQMRCRRLAGSEAQQRRLLKGTAAPGISRHHWGTDVDLFDVDRRRFADDGALGGVYAWLVSHAYQHGFFQSFHGGADDAENSYLAERWHWSYAPISQAILDVIGANEGRFSMALNSLWDQLEADWNRNRETPIPLYSLVRKVWRDYFYTLGPAWPEP